MNLPEGVTLLKRDYIETDDDRFLRILVEHAGEKKWFARSFGYATVARAEELIVNKMKEVWKL